MSFSEFLKKKWVRWLPGVLISAIAIFAVIRFTYLQDFKAAFNTVSLPFVVIIACLMILSLIVRAIAWRTILGNRVDFKTVFFGISEGYFLNNLLPLRAGEFGRALFVGRASGLGTFHILSTILIERAFDILYAAGIILITLPFVIGADWIKPIAFSAFGLVMLVLVFLFVIARNQERTLGWVNRLNIREGFIKSKIIPQVAKMMDGMTALVKPSRFLLSLFWIGACWLIWTGLYYTAVSQVVKDAPLWWGAFIGSLLALGVAIPSAPAAVGVFEASMVGAFAILGVSSSSALAYAIVLHLNQVIISAVFGIWGLIRDGRRFSTILDSIVEKELPEKMEA